MRYNPPPNWPPPPPGWAPKPGWEPNLGWGPEPPGWPLWVDDGPPTIPPTPPEPAYESPPAYANTHPAGPSGQPAGPIDPPQYITPGYYQPPPPRRTGAAWIAAAGVVAVFATVFVVLLASTSGTVGPSDEELIRDTVSAMESAYNDADPAGFLSLICEDKRPEFPDDAESMRQALQFGGKISLIVDTVYINGDHARADVSGEIFADEFEETWRFVLEEDHWLWCND
ncbi:MAG: Rv0361 family membrane protein [Mycobacterium sp.]